MTDYNTAKHPGEAPEPSEESGPFDQRAATLPDLLALLAALPDEQKHAAQKALGVCREMAISAQAVAARADSAERENAELRERAERLDGRRREGRQLLRRMVKYATEDRAETPGSTRLARLTEQVRDYLSRTGEPTDILRGKDPANAE